MAEQNAELVLEARMRDLVSAEIKKVETNATRGFGKAGKQAESFGKKTGKAFANVKSEMGSFLKRFGPGLLLVAGFTKALSLLGNAIRFVDERSKAFGKEMSKVQAVLGDKASVEGMKALNDEALRLGSTTAFSASEAASAFSELAKQGFNTNQILAATGPILDIAAAAEVDLAFAAEATARTLGQFNLDASETVRVTDVMARSFSSSALDMTRFTESMKFVGATANATGIDLETTTAALAALANKGILGSQAGTALRRIMLEMANASSKASAAINRVNPAADKFVDKLEALRKAKLTPAEIKDTFGLLSTTAAIILIEGAEAVEKFEEAFRKGTLTAKEMAKVMLNNVAGATKILESAQEGLALAIGKSFEEAKLKRLEFYQNLINAATKFVKEHEVSLRILANFLSGAFLTTIEFVGRVMITTFQGTLSVILAVVGGVAKGIEGLIDLSNKVPGINIDATRFKVFGDEIIENAREAGEKAREAFIGDTSKSIFESEVSQETVARAVGKVSGVAEDPVDTQAIENEKALKEREKFLKEVKQLEMSFLNSTHEGRIEALNIQRDELLERAMSDKDAIVEIEREFNRRVDEEKLKQFDKDLDLFIKEIDAEEKQALEIQKIRKKETKRIQKEEKIRAKARLDAKNIIIDSALDTAKSLIKITGDNGKALKAFAIVESVINGFRAVQNTLASIPAPFNIPAAVAVGVAAAANTAAIASQAFQTGGLPVGRNANIQVNEAGQEAVLNAGATSRLGAGGVNALNAGQNTQITNEISFSPTLNIGQGNEANILDALREGREEFAEFFQKDIVDRGFLETA